MPRQINRTQDITFNITHHFGVLDTSQSGWTKEVNLVEWNGKPEKLDIREWDPEHEHMSRGVTLRKNETLTLLDILYRNFGEELTSSRSFNSRPETREPQPYPQRSQPQAEETACDEGEERAECESCGPCAPDEEGIASSEQF
ncbi:MAG: YdbC family protein [Anaerovoracaceae bacterium]